MANGQVDFFRRKLTKTKSDLEEATSLKEQALKQVQDVEAKQKDVEIPTMIDRDEIQKELDQVKVELQDAIKKINDKASKLELANGQVDFFRQKLS